MKWNNALRDTLPSHKEEVIISVDGVNYISVFCANNQSFNVEDGLKETSYKPGEYIIYWTRVKNQTTGNYNQVPIPFNSQ